MNAYIHFYINQANQTIKLPSFVSSFKDVSTIDYEAKKIPLNFSKYLPGSSERKINLSLDVFGENYEQARDNFRNLSILNRLMFLLRDEQTGNPRKTAILNVLYQNLIIRPNQNPAGNVKDVGLPCYMTTYEQEIQYESGFYTYEQYVFPKLVKVSMTLIPVLKATGVDSPSWSVDSNGNINIASNNYKSNWPTAIPTYTTPAVQRPSIQKPTGQSNDPPKTAVEAARQANVDTAAAAGAGVNNQTNGQAQPNPNAGAAAGGTKPTESTSVTTTSTDSVESPNYSFTNKKRDDGTEITMEEKKKISSKLEEQVGKKKAEDIKSQISAVTGK